MLPSLHFFGSEVVPPFGKF